MIRSYLFVPGDRPDLMRKAIASGADALILDLEDSVTLQSKDLARNHVLSFLDEQDGTGPRMFVRVNPLGTAFFAEDIGVAKDGQAYGLVLPKAEGGQSVERLCEHLRGARLWIMPIVTETPRAVFMTGSFEGCSDDLVAMTWGAEDLSSAIGASRISDEDGRYAAPYELARSLTLFGASAAGVDPVETVYPAFRDLEGLRAYAQRGRQDGFRGMMAIHPAQVAIINSAFEVTAAEVSEARRIVGLFGDNPGSGALSLDGKMVDAPHLKKARRLLERL